MIENCVVCKKYLETEELQEQGMCNKCDDITDKIAKDIQGEQLPIHNVIKPKGTVCVHTDTYYDARCGNVCKECRCVIPE